MTHLSEGEKLHLLSEFDSLDSLFDILLIDTSAGISSNVLYFNIAAGERIVVATPEPTSMTDAYALIKVLHTKHGTDSFGMLVNMVSGADEAASVYKNVSAAVSRFLSGISFDYLGFIPTDEMCKKAVRQQRALVQLYPEAASSKSILRLARSLLEQPRNNSVSDGNIKFFWRKMVSSCQ